MSDRRPRVTAAGTGRLNLKLFAWIRDSRSAEGGTEWGAGLQLMSEGAGFVELPLESEEQQLIHSITATLEPPAPNNQLSAEEPPYLLAGCTSVAVDPKVAGLNLTVSLTLERRAKHTVKPDDFGWAPDGSHAQWEGWYTLSLVDAAPKLIPVDSGARAGNYATANGTVVPRSFPAFPGAGSEAGVVASHTNKSGRSPSGTASTSLSKRTVCISPKNDKLSVEGSSGKVQSPKGEENMSLADPFAVRLQSLIDADPTISYTVVKAALTEEFGQFSFDQRKEMVKDYLVHVGRDLDDGDRTWVFLDRPDFVHADVTSTEQATPPPSFGSVVGTSTTTAPRPLPGAAPLVHGEMPGPSTPPWPASFMETFVRGSSRQDDMSADTAVRGSLCSTVGGSTPNRRVSRDPQPKAEAEATIAGAAASIPTVQKTSFRPGKVLGTGAFGHVFEATLEPDTLGPGSGILHVAVKQLRQANIGSDESVSSMFLSELNTIARASNVDGTNERHPNVIKVLGASGPTSTELYFVMELCAGGSLRTKLDRHQPPCKPPFKPLSAGTIFAWIKGIAKGMRHIQHKRIYHRDLKPANVMLRAAAEVTSAADQERMIVITDFGLSKIAPDAVNMSVAATATQVGSMLYMAPEIITKHQLTKFADVWSFGVIVWEMLNAREPYSFSGIERGPRLAAAVGYDQLTPAMVFWPPPFEKIVHGYSSMNAVFSGFFSFTSPSIAALSLSKFRTGADDDFPTVLLIDCLSQEFEERPSFPLIVDKLESSNIFASLTDDDLTEKRNRWATEMKDHAARFADWLELKRALIKITGEDYKNLLREKGFESVKDFEDFSEAELEEFGFPRVKARKIKKKLAEAAADVKDQQATITPNQVANGGSKGDIAMSA